MGKEGSSQQKRMENGTDQRDREMKYRNERNTEEGDREKRDREVKYSREKRQDREHIGFIPMNL